MAVSKTGAMFKSLTFDGEDSRDYGVYITGQAVFNAPEREVEMISIPGRNGQFALDMGRFVNIEVTYPAGIFANTEAEFAEAVSNFRNLLCSKRGYVRLQDEYHPDEYRMAIYKSGLELENVALKAGEFEITFDCKPQRYLTSGEEEITIGGSGTTETISGDIVQIDNPDGNIAVQSLSVLLVATQSGSGTPSPDNIRPISGYDTVDVIVSPTTSALDGQTYTTTLPETVYGGALNVITGELILNMGSVDLGTLTWSSQSSPSQYSYYSNVLSDIKKPVDTASLGNYLCEQYSETVSGSFLSRGNNKYCVSQGSRININDNRYDNEASFKTAMNGVKLVYELITPRTIQLTPEDIDLLLGTNNVWSDGTITVTYAEDLSRIYNPTLFDAEPLLEVEGYGTIGFNGYEIELESGNIGTVSLWNNTSVNSVNTTINKSFSVNMFEPTDTFSFNVVTGYSTIYEDYGSVSNTDANATYQHGDNNDGSIWIFITLPCTFTVGTSSTITNTGTCSLGGGNSAVFTMTVAYDGAGNITYTVSTTVSAGVSVYLPQTEIRACSADSTLTRLGHPTYIDCELGECYKYENGSIVSLNAYIDLGSDLPKLAPGGNEFTIDNTITELKVVPKWWKV